MRMAVKNMYGAHLEVVEVASTAAAQRWINKWYQRPGDGPDQAVEYGLLYTEAEWADEGEVTPVRIEQDAHSDRDRNVRW